MAQAVKLKIVNLPRKPRCVKALEDLIIEFLKCKEITG